MKTIAFYNNHGGVGKSSLIYHLAWSYADEGKRVLLVDLDPQSKLTAISLEDSRLETLWPNEDALRLSIRGAIEPILQEVGDVQGAHLESITERIALIPGDIRLSGFEQSLADAWLRTSDRQATVLPTLASFYRVIQTAAADHQAHITLVDIGPNLGAINRCALISADYVVTPLAADLYSIQGLKNLGPSLADWRSGWKDRLDHNPISGLQLPPGKMQPIGYVVMQPNLYSGSAITAYDRWLQAIPEIYHRYLLRDSDQHAPRIKEDPYNLAVLKHYRSLMPLAQEKRKPLFKLTAADGAIGAHASAAREIGEDFRKLAKAIWERTSSEAATLDTIVN